MDKLNNASTESDSDSDGDGHGDMWEMLRQAKQQRFYNLQQLKKNDPEQYKKQQCEYMIALCNENPEKYKEYREANKEKVAKQKKSYREANKEKIAKQNKTYRDANKAKIAEQNKSYRAKKTAEKHNYQPSCISFFSQEDAFEMSDLGDDR
jgi:hypothetical protein